MSKNLQKAVIYGSLMLTILVQYEEEERTKVINTMTYRLSKMLIKTKRDNASIYFTSTIIAEKAWDDALKYFSKEAKKIDASTCINDFYGEAPKQLQKYATISPVLLAKYTNMENNRVIDSYEVSECIISNIYAALGEKRLILSDKLKAYKENK